MRRSRPDHNFLRLATLGAAFWTLGLFVWFDAARPNAIERILLFGVLGIAPLVLAIIGLTDPVANDARAYRLAAILALAGAPAATLAFFLEPGPLAAGLVLPWLGAAVAGFCLGLKRLLHRGLSPLSETAVDAGLLYWPVGAVWMIAARLEYPLLGFSDDIVLLTGVHFHFAGLAAPALAGFAGRRLEGAFPRAYPIAAVLVIAGVPLTAAGIYASPLVEWISATALALGVLLLSTLLVLHAAPEAIRSGRRFAGALLILSALSSVVSMAYAALYAANAYRGTPLPISEMILFHGWWNALGFAGAGLLAWLDLRPAPLAIIVPIQFSRLRSRGRVGGDFFEREGLVPAVDKAVRPRGLVDSLAAYDRPDFQSASLAPELRRFYERTEEYKLLIRPDWRPGFRLAARLYKYVFSSRIEQMNFPLAAESREDQITSRILPIRDELDGRARVRAWVRTYSETGRAVYAAAYSDHRRDGKTFMNIAFPLPGANMTSVLRLNTVADRPGALVLTSFPEATDRGDEGVYLATRWFYLRLPINETIAVYPAAESRERNENRGPEILLTARHDMYLFGLRCLTLEYQIYRADDKRAPVEELGRQAGQA
jgi:hypothetical protein